MFSARESAKHKFRMKYEYRGSHMVNDKRLKFISFVDASREFPKKPVHRFPGARLEIYRHRRSARHD
jgi:hypothetical protein